MSHSMGIQKKILCIVLAIVLTLSGVPFSSLTVNEAQAATTSSSENSSSVSSDAADSSSGSEAENSSESELEAETNSDSGAETDSDSQSSSNTSTGSSAATNPDSDSESSASSNLSSSSDSTPTITLSTLSTSANITIKDGYELYSDGFEDGTPDYYTGDTGTITYAGSYTDIRFESNNTSAATVNAQTGVYTVVGPGLVTITVYGVDSDDAESDEEACASYSFCCGASMSSASLKSSSGKLYVCGSWEDCTSGTISFKNMPSVGSYYTFSYTQSLSYSAYLKASSGVYVDDVTFNASKKTITFETEGTGSTTLKLTINNKTFSYKITVKRVTLNSGTALVKKGKTKTLKLKNYSGTVKWSSSNKKVATVTSKGKVKAKKTGTCIIYATFNGQKVGCAVSVVTAKRYKVIQRAKSIGKGTYSQAKRMQKGYYDCSSLVWRAYKLEKIYFGVKGSWAPTAAAIGKWGVTKGKKIKGGCSNSNVSKLKLRAGDLFFRTGSSNGRYKGIYHVEMMTGYRWVGTQDNGKPYLLLTWATRSDGYGQGSGELMIRP